MPPRLVGRGRGHGRGHGTQPDPTSLRNHSSISLLLPFVPMTSSYDAYGSAYRHSPGPPIEAVSYSAISEPSPSCIPTLHCPEQPASFRLHGRHKPAHPPKTLKPTILTPGDVQSVEDQDVITTARKLIVIDMITVHGWLTKVNKAVLQSAIRECINQGNAKHNRTLEATGDVISLVSQELSTVRGRLATISEAHTHHYALRPEVSISDEDDQRYMEHRRSILYDTSQANYPNYFLHYCNPKIGELVLFGHPAIRGTHLVGWYDNPLSPIYDESYRRKITMTPERMLTLSAASIHCGIDRHVEGCLLRLGSVLSFEGSAYACVEQGIYDVFMAAKRMHPEMMEKFMYNLHQEGLAKMRKRLGISSPTKGLNIYIPSADDLSADRNSLRLEEAPSPGPSNYLHLEVLSAGPSTSSYPHFDQPPPSPFPQMGHLEAPYPDMPGRYSPTAHFPRCVTIAWTLANSLQSKMRCWWTPTTTHRIKVLNHRTRSLLCRGGYSTTSTGEDALEGFGEFENFAPGSWNASYY
ncbi:uncharacterized protein F5891DRAFT_1190925 [Suillus fuscotomentosus]|uniref:DUF6532 domain-containing protein n=1 Tax=Suillus fuscotomentosus TaxID=1912939 RepID=A0AAD4E2W7_9AGAM|nr:uncharacterized protein F5891DRAFT_1190925 [Suillus fuscotomentosus]KAG1898261.1 hypothetical protein F5891DRAFT_1190925 [Suillus fuscotomentosus]